MHISTGKHLSELCKFEYPKYVKYCLWLLAEFAVICADIPEGKTIKFTLFFFFFKGYFYIHAFTSLIILEFSSHPCLLVHIQIKGRMTHQINKQQDNIDLVINKLFNFPIRGSDWDSFCTKYIIPPPTLDWSSHHWFKHSLTSWPAEIWGNLFINYLKFPMA